MSCLTSSALKGRVRNNDDLSPESKELLLQMDPLTILLCTTLPDSVIADNTKPSTDMDIKTSETDLGWRKTGKGFSDWKRVHVKDMDVTLSDDFSTTMLREDDFHGTYTAFEKATSRALRNRYLFKAEDITAFTATDKLLRELKYVEGQAFPVSYSKDFNLRTDESFSRMFFFGIAAPLLAAQIEDHDESIKAPELGPFVVDMALQNLKVRPGFLKYGCRVHFSYDQMVTAIHYHGDGKTVLRGQEGWERAKLIAKVSAFLLITAREHLVWTHVILSNMATKASTLRMRPSHPLRRLLTVFTYRTNEVNTSASGALIPKFCVLHRSTGLTYEAMQEVFDMSFKTCNVYEPFPNREVNPTLQKLAKEGKFPYIHEGIGYYEVVREFVVAWCSNAGAGALQDEEAKAFYEAIRKSSEGQAYVLPPITEEDAMVDLLTQIIFTVTAFHELVGHVVDYIKDPDRAGFRVSENTAEANQTLIDVQSLLLTAGIGAVTSIRMPSLMGAFPNFFGVGGAPAWERQVWNDFVAKLGQFSAEVQAADADRSVEYKYSDPARFECSVSV